MNARADANHEAIKDVEARLEAKLEDQYKKQHRQSAKGVHIPSTIHRTRMDTIREVRSLSTNRTDY